MVRSDIPQAHGALRTPAEMVDRVRRELEQYVSPEDAEAIARRAVALLINNGHVTEWGLTEEGYPLYEPRSHIIFVV